MKIAVCGAGKDTNEIILKKSFEIGREIAENKAVLVNGAGIGYPLEAAKGAFLNNGKVIGFSPAKDEKEHKEVYGFETECYTKINYTGSGIPKRNFDIIENSDAVIIIGGQAGTLSEFSIAFALNKIIAILKNSGGIAKIMEKIVDICKKNGEDKNVVYSDKPEELIKKVIEKLK
jgi:uncharacterized protein (TIGR00725 family)